MVWAKRRQLGIPTNKRLFILACMDERLPLYEALGIHQGDAHIFRNAGGLVTDDAIRSAMLSTQFSGTQEILVINHTECGLMTATGESIINQLKERGIDVDNVRINPALPELKLENQKNDLAKWIQAFTNVDDICEKQVELLRESPFIPQDVAIHGYIWQVESMKFRLPYNHDNEKINPVETTWTAKITLCENCGCLHERGNECRCII